MLRSNFHIYTRLQEHGELGGEVKSICQWIDKILGWKGAANSNVEALGRRRSCSSAYCGIFDH